MRYGLVGEKLGHSLSPEIHAALGGYSYGLCELPPEAFDGFMRARGFAGVNVTIPYKRRAAQCCDAVDERAARIGAVNTVVNRGGLLYGSNTDYDGFIYLLRTGGIQLRGRQVLVLGGGGGSAAVRAAALDEGAAAVRWASRAPAGGGISYAQAAAEAGTQVVINTTPVGMAPAAPAAPIDLAVFPRLQAVIDIIYNPLATRLLLRARRLGVKAVNGLGMLVEQARAAGCLFPGVEVRGDTRAVHAGLLLRRANAVLIGMPGCGKTSLGMALARQMGREFVDLDAEVERRAGMPIPEIFAGAGEGAFRAMEAEAAAEAGAGFGRVIATGGGCVLRGENVDSLRQNGALLFIDCPAHMLPVGDGRPLAKTARDLAALEKKRRPVYGAAADCVIEYDGSFEENLRRVAAAFGEWAARSAGECHSH